jgi:prepilin-type processing-associated H-X9-DG protein
MAIHQREKCSSSIVSQNFQVRRPPPPAGSDGDSFDFIKYSHVSRASDVVFLAEGGFYNFNGEAYKMQNASMGNLRQVGTNQLRPRITHPGLNYLFFDGHVSCELKPPQAIGNDVGTFVTADGERYGITSLDIAVTYKLLGLQ